MYSETDAPSVYSCVIDEVRATGELAPRNTVYASHGIHVSIGITWERDSSLFCLLFKCSAVEWPLAVLVRGSS